MWRAVAFLVVGLVGAWAINSPIVAILSGAAAMVWAILSAGDAIAAAIQASHRHQRKSREARDPATSDATCSAPPLPRRQRLDPDVAYRLRQDHVRGLHDERKPGERVRGCPTCKETWLLNRHANGHHWRRWVVGCFACRKAWVRNDEHAERYLNFETMLLTIRVAPFDTETFFDSEAQRAWDEQMERLWNKADREDDWSKDEWLNRTMSQCEVRRTVDGQWQQRPTRRYFQRRVAALLDDLEEGGPASTFAKEPFRQLLGYSWDQWMARDTTGLPENTTRPWQQMADEYVPSMETAYQRYIHQG